MLIILKSIFRMDKDQSSRHLARYCNNKVGWFQLFVIALDSREYFCLIRLSILIAITTRPTSFSTTLSNRTRKMAQPRESSIILSINWLNWWTKWIVNGQVHATVSHRSFP
jgi:hypothetical protein